MLPLLRVLVLIDTIADSDMLAHELRRAGFELMLRRATTEAAYLAALESPLDLILADNALPAFDAMRALQILRTSARDIPLIVVTESASEASAIECVSLGAADFLFKDRPARLGSAVVRALDQRELRVHARAVDAALHASAAINQAVLDSLTAHIAVLNVHGVIVAVNQAWQRFARENGDQDVTHTDVGINYLDVCDPATGLDSEPVAQGIAAVLAHELDQFMIEYPCHSPHEQRWFIMRVTPLAGEYQGAVVSHENITARRRSDATRALLAAVVDSSDDAIISVAPDGTVMSWNSGAEHVYGYRAEHMIGQPIALLRPTAMQDEAAQMYDQLARDAITTHVETVRQRNDGQLIDVALTISTINDVSGGSSGFSTISRDISARKRDERVLRQKSAFIQLFQEVAAAANQATSLDQALQTAVDAICRSIGWPVGHVYLPDPDRSGALLPTSIWHLEDAQRFATFRAITKIVRLAPGIGLPGQVMASRKPAWITDMILDVSTPRTRVMQEIGVRAGFALPVLLGDDVAAVLEFFATEAIVPDDALLEVLHHVSTQLGRVVERARAEAALRESEARFRVLFEHSPDAVVLIDPHASGVVWPIVECNDVACRMNGYTRAELIGQSIDILNTKIDTLAGRAVYIEELRRAGTLHVEVVHRRKDGSLFPIEVVSSLIMVAGRELVLGIDRDISERKRAGEALRAAEAQYRTLVEQIPAIIYTAAIDAHSSTSYVSPQIATILGFSPEEWLVDPQFWLTQVHPDDRARVLDAVERSHTSDLPIPVEYRSATRDGGLVWLRDTARVVRNDTGQPLFLQGITLDITERKQAEAALRLTQFCVDQALVGIMRTGADANILEVNNYMCQKLGYSAEELCQMYVYDIDPNFPFDHWREHRSSLRTSGSDTFETIHRRKDGATFPVEITTNYLEFQGEVFSFSFSSDITERKRAEAALRAAESQYRTLVEQIPAIIYSAAIDEQSSTSYVSPQIETILGFSPEEWLASPTLWLEQIHPDDRAAVLAAVDRARTSDTPVPLEYRAFMRDGRLVWLSDAARVVRDETGQALFLQGISLDITARKHAEEALALYQMLSENARDIILFLRGDGQIIEANQAALLAYGYTRDELLARSIYDLRPAGTHGEVDARLAQVDGAGILYETIHCRQDARLFPVEVGSRGAVIGGERVIVSIIRDITERKHAEAALAEREAYFRALIEHSTDAIMLLGADGIISYGSPATSRILGYALHDFVGHNAFEFLAPEDHAQIAQKILHIVDLPEASVTVQARVQHADGSWRDLEGRFTNLLHDPAVGAIINNYRDVTERKRAEVAVRESERRYRTLASNFPNGAVVLFDHDLRFTIADGSGLTDIGISPGQLEGHTLWEIYPPEASLVNEPIFRAALAGTPNIREVTTGELTLVIHTLPVRDEHGEIIAGMLMSQNITEHKRIEEELRMSAARFRAVWESAHDAMVLSDPEGMVLQANPAYYQLYGYVPDQIIGQPYSIIFPAEQRAAAMEEYQTFFRLPQSLVNVESIIHRADGTECWIESSVSFITQDGQRTALLSLTRDITERKRMEAALSEERSLLARRVDERTADLSAANAELARTAILKDEFLASMSHELRTPLNAVLGLSEALQEEIYGPLNDRQRRSLHSIEESGRHLLELINDILDLAKIGAGKLELHLEPASVELICQASLRLITQLAHQKQLSVDLKLDPAVTLLHVDARRVKQILVNLLSNAVKFTPEGGSIGLEVTGDAARQAVDLTVWDTGIGIAQEHMGNLFQPFVQLDSRLARQYEGTGLGLALVYRMVELHGGSITVTSNIGLGSRFTVALPWHSAHADTYASASATADVITSDHTLFHRALIIEDSPTTADQITRYLHELAITSDTMRVGAGVVALAITEQPDLILLDLLLPDGSGWDVLAQLKAEPRTRAIPVVIISVIDERARALALGAADYLVKPVTRADLQRVLSMRAHMLIPHALSAITPPARALAQPVVLLAEDNAATITMIADYLGARGYQVVVARNGAEAIARAREVQPAIVLMDIQMPGMDGIEATRRIRTIDELVDLPIIALTALAMPGDRERCLAAGATAYLSKPVSLHALASLIATTLHAQINPQRNYI